LYWIPCPVCDAPVPAIISPGADETLSAAITEMDRNADERRDFEAGRICYYQPPGPGRFDVFLSYNSADRQAVSEIAIELEKRKIRPWFDEWELKPGTRWIVALQEQIGNVGAAAVFVGPSGLGPWQDIEQQQILSECVRRRAPVIPVILPGCSQEPELPPFFGARLQTRLIGWYGGLQASEETPRRQTLDVGTRVAPSGTPRGGCPVNAGRGRLPSPPVEKCGLLDQTSSSWRRSDASHQPGRLSVHSQPLRRHPTGSAC
jgi:hypothetical protein